jgi:hypothetical protein
MVLSPPFKGDGWVNGNGCCKEIGPHRFVMNSIKWALRPTEEFAIDWIRVDAQGRLFHGDPKDVKNWYGYGADVLAVGAGTVVEVVRDLPDEPPGASPTNLIMGQVGGNRVIIDMGNGRYAEYEHLVPNSPTAHVGDYVRQGEKIGLLGSTGNTDAPHLHLQIMDRPSSLDGSALPFVVDRMRLEGRIPLDLQELEDVMKKAEPVPRAHHGGHGRICSRDEAWRGEHPALCVLPGFLSCLPCSSQDRRIGVRRPFQYVSIAKLRGELELVGIWMF